MGTRVRAKYAPPPEPSELPAQLPTSRGVVCGDDLAKRAERAFENTYGAKEARVLLT